MYQKVVLSLSVILAFALYILAGTPNAPYVATPLPAAVVGNSGTSSAASASSPAAPPPQKQPVAIAAPATSTAKQSPANPRPATTTSPAAPAPPPAPTPVPAPAPAAPAQPQGPYKNGTYTGSVADAYYGNVQVQATIKNGFIADVQFLQYPSDRRTSAMINSQAMPYLTQEAIQAQSANVNIVSGATETSTAFQQSLASALSQAKA